MEKIVLYILNTIASIIKYNVNEKIKRKRENWWKGDLFLFLNLMDWVYLRFYSQSQNLKIKKLYQHQKVLYDFIFLDLGGILTRNPIFRMRSIEELCGRVGWEWILFKSRKESGEANFTKLKGWFWSCNQNGSIIIKV